MERNADGQLVAAKELDMYTIPKRRGPAGYAGSESGSVGHGTVLADAYSCTDSYQSNGGIPVWQNPPPNYTHYQQYATNYKVQNVQAKRLREEPKTSKAGMTYRDSFPDINDSTLPKELTAMFQPLFCKLCSAQLSSNVMAKMHYVSKNHDKKVRRFLVEHSEKTGEPLHKRAKLPKAAEAAETYNPSHYHCTVCDLPLTGKSHAESHYMGKNHQKAVMGKKAPAGKGYYDDDGKWVRTTAMKSDPTGRDGFGQDFIVTKQATPFNETSGKSLRCDLCNVSVTSAPQLEMHLQGQKHQKKVKQVASGALPNMFSPDLPLADNETSSDTTMVSEVYKFGKKLYCNGKLSDRRSNQTSTIVPATDVAEFKQGNGTVLNILITTNGQTHLMETNYVKLPTGRHNVSNHNSSRHSISNHNSSRHSVSNHNSCHPDSVYPDGNDYGRTAIIIGNSIKQHQSQQS